MTTITLNDMDGFVISRIFDMLYQDRDIITMTQLSYVSPHFDSIGREYISKYFDEEDKRQMEEMRRYEEEDKKYWDDQAEWLRSRLDELRNEFYL